MDRERVLGRIEDLVSDFLYYDRKHDEELPRGEIERMVFEGEITIEEIVERFQRYLEEGIGIEEEEEE